MWRPPGPGFGASPDSSISGSVPGDEIMKIRYCTTRGVHAVEVVRDRFLGEEVVSLRNPVSQDVGDASRADQPLSRAMEGKVLLPGACGLLWGMMGPGGCRSEAWPIDAISELWQSRHAVIAARS